jgi:hypothetical protein
MRAIKCMSFLRRLSRFLALSLVLLSAPTPGQADQQQSGSAGPLVLTGFVRQSDLGPGSKVIETAEQLADFVSCLPDELPSKKQPAPPNPDRFRHGFSPDFSQEVLVVVVHRDTISAFPVYKGLKVNSDGRVVKFDVPGPPPEARPYGWGVYTAVILPRSSLPTKIQETAVQGDC